MSGDAGLKRSLRWSVVDGCGHSFMLGSGEAYLIPFAVFLGAHEVVLGLIAALPLFVGAIAQIGSIAILDRYRRRCFLMKVFSAAQALSWIPLFALPVLIPDHGPVLLLAGVVLYMAFGHLTIPIWSSWIGDLVPEEIRGRYLGRRTRVLSLFTCIGLVVGAVALQGATAAGVEAAGFGIAFALAMGARGISAYAHSRVVELPYDPPRAEDRFSFLQFLRQSGRSNFTKFVLFVAALHAATNLAAPFFTLYMLRDLHFSYLQLLAAGGAMVVTQYLTLHTWGALSDRIGNRRILGFTGLGVSLLPLLWLPSTDFAWILGVQCLSGVLWGGFNLSTSNFIFDAVSPAKRGRCFGYFNLLVQGGVLAGSAGGGLLAPHLGTRIDLSGMEVTFAYPLMTLFFLSAILRFGVILFLLPIFQEVRPVQSLRSWELLSNVIGIRAIRGLQFGIHLRGKVSRPPGEVNEGGGPPAGDPPGSSP